jgi:hypothetical protein
MNFYHSEADATACQYMGVDGAVYAHPSANTAVKIHRGPDGFARELAAYLRLADHGVTEFVTPTHRFNVPVLHNYDEKLRVIEMSIVIKPFLLDFAAATLDDPRDYTDDALGSWWDSIQSDFGDDFIVARDVYWGLVHRFGIYYWDLKPRNLCLR